MPKRPSSMPINIERPQSALLRGVRITEYKDNLINPDPIVLQETDFLLEEFLSPTKLKALTGVDDLEAVDNLEMVVDTSETSLGNFGIYLPNLKQLKLNSSFVPRIRDLGTSLGHLKVLWLARSGLSDLDGIPALNNLQELYLAYNEIQDLSPCSMLENLKALDLEGNLIEDIRQVEFLSLCSNLSSLTLEGNPICIKPNAETQPNAKYNYRREVTKMLPNLKSLDDEIVVKNEKIKDKKEDFSNFDQHNQCPFDDDWELINKCLEEGVGPPEEKLEINKCQRPGTSSSHGNSPAPNLLRPLSAMRPICSSRPGSALHRRPTSGSRLATAGPAANTPSLPRPYSDPMNDMINDASELTIGPTLYGNPIRGLISRRKAKNPEPVTNQPTDTGNKRKSQENKKIESNNFSENEKNGELYKELKSWRKEHERKMEERKKYFEPQVLRIDDYAEPVLSDNDDDEVEDDENVNEYEVEDELNKYESKASLYKEQNDEQKHNSKRTPFKKSQEYDEISLYNTNSNRIGSATSINTNTSSPSESTASSRVPTGDTGYASISDASYSSLSSKTNLKTTLQNSLTNTTMRQPVIISANSTQATNKTGTSGSSLSKKLANNIAALPGIKVVKN